MSKLLHLDSSGRSAMSVTHALTAYYAKNWKEANPTGSVIYRNLGESDLQFVDADVIAAYFTPEEQRTNAQKSLLAQSDALAAELIDADTYVFGIPMYNFSVPAVFKAYIDLVSRAGKTFRYEDAGFPVGLLKNKKLVVVTASGGDYSSDPMKNFDFLEPYVRAIMSFLGVTDITFIKAHGSNPETIAATTEVAMRQVEGLLQTSSAK